MSQQGCDEIEPDVILFTTHPDFPSCRLTIEYDLRVCQGEFQIANVSVSIGQVQDVECDLNFSIFNNFFGGSQLDLELFLLSFWSGIEEQIANSIWEETLASGSTAILECGNFDTFTAGFYKGSCVSFCVGMRPNGTLTINQQSCGRTCCVERREYCLDPVTGETVIEISTEQLIPGECIFLDLPVCRGESLFQSPCFAVCEGE